MKSHPPRFCWQSFRTGGKVAFLALSALFTLPSLHAQDPEVYWGGGSSGSWADVANWLNFNNTPNGALPSNTEFATFDALSPNNLTTLGGNQSVGAILFEDFPNPFTLGDINSADVMTLVGIGELGLKIDPTISNRSSNATINFNISIGTLQRWENQSDKVLTTAGNVTLGANLTLTDDPVAAAFNPGGSFVIGSAGKALINSGGDRTLFVQSTGAATELTIAGDVYVTESATGRRFTMDMAADTAAVISGNVLNGAGGAGASSFTKTGLGTLTINGNLAYTATGTQSSTASGTVVTGGGTLNINGNMSNGATHTLTTTGTGSTLNIGGSGNTITAGGLWVVGNSTDLNFTGSTTLAIGGLTINNNNVVNFTSTSNITGTTGAWSVGVDSVVDIDGALNITASGALTVAQGLIDWSQGTGAATFTGITIGSNSVDSLGEIRLNTGVVLSVTGDITSRRGSTSLLIGGGTLNLNGARNFGVADNAGVDRDLVISSAMANGTGTGGITKNGNGTLALTGANTFTGPTTVNTGRLLLDYTTQNNSKIGPAGTVSLQDGIIEFLGNAAGTTQSIGNIGLTGTGASQFILAPNGGTLTVDAGTITGGASTRTVRFVIPASSSVNTTTATTNFIGTWATMNNGTADFYAGVSGGKVVATLSNDGDDLSRGWASTLVNQNLTDDTGFTGTSDYMNVNSLRFSAGNSLTVLENLNLQSGGLLISSGSAAAGIQGGTLTSTTNSFLLTHYGSQEFTINSSIQGFNNSSVVGATGVVINKTGTGTVVLGGFNVTGERGTLNMPTSAATFTGVSSGNINIVEGTLAVTGGNAVSDNTSVTLLGADATFRLDASESIGNLAAAGAGTVDLQSHTLAVRATGSPTFAGTIVGDVNSKFIKTNMIAGANLNVASAAGIVSAGSTNYSITGANTNFLGTLQVDGGLLLLSGSMNGVSKVAINQSGALLLDSSSANSTRINDAAEIVLTSANGAASGNSALLRGLWTRAGANAVVNEVVGALTLQGGSSYILQEALASGTATTSVTLTVASINRQNNSTLAIRGTRLGIAAGTTGKTAVVVSQTGNADETFGNSFRVGGGTYANGGTAQGTVVTAGAKDISIVPYMLAEALTGVQDPRPAPGNSFITYDASYGAAANAGFRALNLSTEYAAYTDAAATANGTNVRISATDATLTGKTINSLVLNSNSSTAVTVTGTGTLNVTSGAFLFTSVGAVDAIGSATALAAGSASGDITLNFGQITVGGGNAEYIMFANSLSTNGTTINAALTSAAKFTKSGIGLLTLTGANSALTDVTINEGTLSITSLANIGGGDGNITFGGGTLLLGAAYNNDSLAARTINVIDGTNGRLQIASTRDVTAGIVNASGTDFIKAGGGILRLGNGSTITAERFIVENNTESALNLGVAPQVVLNNTTGIAINGDLQIGSGVTTAGNNGTAVVHIAANEQIVNTGVIRFNGTARADAVGREAYLTMLGHTETVAGIEAMDSTVETGGAVIHNAHGAAGTVGTAQGHLILAGSGDYYYGGTIRDNTSGTTANQGTIAITKSGTGTQTIAGEFIKYTGTTTISGGVLRLRNTVNLQSNIVNNATLEIERTKDANWTYNGVISGSGNLRKTGPSGVTNGYTILGGVNTYSGTTDIDAGSLSLAAAGSINNSRAINIKSGATFGLSAKGSAGYNYGHILSGEGSVSGTITLLNGGSLRPGASTNPLVDATTGNQMGQLTITAGSFGLNNSTALLQIGQATTNDVGITTAYENNTLAAYISSQATTWNALSVNDASGAPKHDSINIGGSFTWSNGGLITYQAVDGYVPAAGDVYDLWDWVGVGSTFTSVSTGADGNNQRIGGILGNLELPELQGGLFYDLSQFQNYGIIVVAGVVPEPSRALLFMLGAGLLLMRRRRR